MTYMQEPNLSVMPRSSNIFCAQIFFRT